MCPQMFEDIGHSVIARRQMAAFVTAAPTITTANTPERRGTAAGPHMDLIAQKTALQTQYNACRIGNSITRRPIDEADFSCLHCDCEFDPAPASAARETPCR